MAVLSKDEFFSKLQTMVGDSADADTIALVEDFTDTYNDLERRGAGDGIDWKARYEENDRAWGEKYKHRFFTGGASCPTQPADEEDPDKPIGIGDLFE